MQDSFTCRFDSRHICYVKCLSAILLVYPNVSETKFVKSNFNFYCSVNFIYSFFFYLIMCLKFQNRYTVNALLCLIFLKAQTVRAVRNCSTNQLKIKLSKNISYKAIVKRLQTEKYKIISNGSSRCGSCIFFGNKIMQKI